MFSTISSRLTAILLSFAALLLAVAGTSQFVLKRQADDALVVNLAGRQRMLTQKLTKEAAQLVAYAHDSTATGLVNSEREQLQSTLRVFEMTLLALKDGGPAPLNLEITRMRPLPPASPEVAKKLDLVVASWQPFKANVNTLVQSGGSDSTAARAVFETNVPLMDQMNAAVTQMQQESEGKLEALFYIQVASLVAGVLLVVLGGWIARATIARPLLKLSAAARSMSTGDLNVDLKVDGAQEVVDLGASFDRMRASMIAVMGGGLANAGANDDL